MSGVTSGTLATYAGIAAAGVTIASGIQNMTSKGPSVPSAIATPADTPAIPTPDNAAILAVQKRSVALQQQTSGRLSTILTGNDNKLGA